MPLSGGPNLQTSLWVIASWKSEYYVAEKGCSYRKIKLYYMLELGKTVEINNTLMTRIV